MTLSGQETKEAVILYNTQAVKAEITSDGTINRIISEEPDYLKGYTLTVQDYGQHIEKSKIKEDKKVASSQPYAVFASEYKLVKFEPNHATLSDEAIDILEELVTQLRKSNDEKVVLVSLSQLENGLINKNRLNSIRSYFKIRGINSERVLIESLLGEKDVDEIKIHFLK
jgi:thymidylate synthase